MSKCTTYLDQDSIQTSFCPPPSTEEADGAIMLTKTTEVPPETFPTLNHASTEDGRGRGDSHATPAIRATSTATPTASDRTNAADGPVVQTPLPTSSVSPAASVSSTAGNNGMSKGAVAGIAIAMLFAGAAIAALTALFIFKRRRRSPDHIYSESTPQLISHIDAKETSYVQVSQNVVPPSLAAAASAHVKQDLDLASLSNSSDFLGGVLPPAASEQMVKSRVEAMFSEIQRHIDNFYRDAQASITPSMEVDLARFGGGSMEMIETLQGSSMPTIAIKNALVGYILSIVSPEADDEATLFPTEISGLKANERSTETIDLQAAYILYKRLAVHLSSPPSTSLLSRRSDMREAGEHFALTFFPWANPIYNDNEKDDDLVQIVSNALELSIWLYGQPYVYEFMWESVGRRGTVVAPGLKKMTNNRGRVLERPRIVLEPVVLAS